MVNYKGTQQAACARFDVPETWPLVGADQNLRVFNVEAPKK